MSGRLQEYRPVFITVNWESGLPGAHVNLPSSLSAFSNKGLKKQ